MTLRARQIFNQSDGAVTKNYYETINTKGPSGQLATALFRAQKRSTAAKRYRGRKFTQAAYEVKNWSLSEICRILKGTTTFPWGWKRDPDTPGYEWVLYIEVPNGQCSFHSAERLDGPDFTGEWARGSSEFVILDFCDAVMDESRIAIPIQPQTISHKQEMLDMRRLYESKSQGVPT